MPSIQDLSIKKYISPLESALKSKGNSTLGSVLSLVGSSHEAVFIFDEDNKFLGLVSPYKTLYSSNYPYTTKVSSIAFKPPFITPDTPLYEVAEHMLAAKIYVLPVFSNDGDLQGTIHARDIFNEIVDNPTLLRFVSSEVRSSTPITAPITASVKDVFNDLKKSGVSRMILVDDEGVLAGIVSRSDLMDVLIKPTPKMRFPGEGSQAGYYSLAGEKKFRKDEPVRKYYTSLVGSLPDTTPKEKIIAHLINSSHNTIVLVDKYRKPTGFYSTRDILQAVTALQPQEDIPFIIKKPESVSSKEFEKSIEYLEKFGRKLQERMEVEKIEIATKGPKNAVEEITVFNTTMIVTPVAGEPLIAKAKKRKFLDGIQELTTLIEKQRKRSGVTKEKTKKHFA